MSQQRSFITVWSMWALASFFYAYQYVLRVLPNIMMNDILEKFHIDAALFGQYSGLYYLGYAGMHIPVGILLDRYGPRWVLSGCILLTVIGLLPLLYAEHWVYPTLGRALIGMGSSAAILGVFKIVRLCFAESKFTVMLGFSVTIGLVGALYGGEPVNYLLNTFGSETVLQMIVAVGVVLACLTAFIVPSIPADKGYHGWWDNVKAVLSQPTIVLVCLLAGLMVGPLEGFADVWGKEYLKVVYKLDDKVAASLPSLIFFGMCFGSPFLSWLAASTKSYFGFIILSAFIMAGSFILLLTGMLTVPMLSLLFTLVGVFCAYQILAIYVASTFVQERLVGLTTACANMIIMVFGYFFHSIIGQILKFSWDQQMNGDVPVYDVQAYTNALSVIPIGLIFAGLGFVILVSCAKKRKLATI